MTDQFPEWLKDMAPTMTEVDPGFVSSIGKLIGAASRLEDPVDGRVRILIAMALDLAAGVSEGTKNMSLTARGFGATEGQIADVVKVCSATAALQRAAIGSVALSTETGAMSDSLGGLGSLLDESDREFQSAAEQVVVAAFDPAAEADDDDDRLTVKDRYLVAFALEAAFGSEARVVSAADRCRQAGANDDEILSVLKIAFVNATLVRLAGGQAAYDFDDFDL